MNCIECLYYSFLEKCQRVFRYKKTRHVFMDGEEVAYLLNFKNKKILNKLSDNKEKISFFIKKEKKEITLINFSGFVKLIKMIHICHYKKCNKLHVRYKCSRCKKVHYCSRRCQKKDWKYRHRYNCF